jgi:hypothetical protein
MGKTVSWGTTPIPGWKGLGIPGITPTTLGAGVPMPALVGCEGVGCGDNNTFYFTHFLHIQIVL